MTYRGYLLLFLLVMLSFNYVDRMALGLLLQDIQRDLHLSDTQMGLITGIAFALFYSIMGLPLARWADRGNRVHIIAVTSLLWSLAVGLCGLAGNFVQLALFRVAASVGEAGCVPVAHSLIGDHFERRERARAVSIFMLGGALSIVIGYLVTGWLNDRIGWRLTFAVLGAPGLLLALLAMLTLREPRRADAGSAAIAAPPQPSMREVLRILWQSPSFVLLLLCFAVSSFFGYGVAQWLPAFFMRSFGLTTSELGVWLTLVYGSAGLVGTFAGGEIASRWFADREAVQLKAMAWGMVAFGLFSALVYLSSDYRVAFALLGLATLGSTAVSGPLFALMQSLAPSRMRAAAVAIVYLFGNLIGMGLGPLCVGALSDLLKANEGTEALRYSLLAMSPGYLLAGWLLWRASAHIGRDLARALSLESGEADARTASPPSAAQARGTAA